MSHGAFCHIGMRQNVTFGAGLRVPILFSEVEMTCRKWLKNKLFGGVLEEKFNFVLNSNPKILKTSSKQNYGKIYAEYRNKLAHGTINPLGDNEIEVYRLLRAMIYILLLDDIKLDEKILSKIIKKVFL